MTELQYNLNDKSYEILQLDTLVQGSNMTNIFKIWLGTIINGSFVPYSGYQTNPDIVVGAIYTRPDGQHTWFLPMNKNQDGSFSSVITGWTLRKDGILKIDIQIKNNSSGDVIALNRFTTTIEAGISLDEDEFNFTESEYNHLLYLISESGNKTYVGDNEPSSQEYGFWYDTGYNNPEPETTSANINDEEVLSNPIGEVDSEPKTTNGEEVLSSPFGEVDSQPIE